MRVLASVPYFSVLLTVASAAEIKPRDGSKDPSYEPSKCSPHTTYTIITPSPNAKPYPVTKQYQQITSYVPEHAVCNPDYKDCTTIYQTRTYHWCSAVVPCYGSACTITDCKQTVTYSHSQSYNLRSVECSTAGNYDYYGTKTYVPSHTTLYYVEPEATYWVASYDDYVKYGYQPEKYQDKCKVEIKTCQEIYPGKPRCYVESTLYQTITQTRPLNPTYQTITETVTKTSQHPHSEVTCYNNKCNEKFPEYTLTSSHLPTYYPHKPVDTPSCNGGECKPGKYPAVKEYPSSTGKKYPPAKEHPPIKEYRPTNEYPSVENYPHKEYLSTKEYQPVDKYPPTKENPHVKANPPTKDYLHFKPKTCTGYGCPSQQLKEQPCYGKNCTKPYPKYKTWYGNNTTVEKYPGHEKCSGEHCPGYPEQPLNCYGKDCHKDYSEKHCSGNRCGPKYSEERPCAGPGCPPNYPEKKPCQGKDRPPTNYPVEKTCHGKYCPIKHPEENPTYSQPTYPAIHPYPAIQSAYARNVAPYNADKRYQSQSPEVPYPTKAVGQEYPPQIYSTRLAPAYPPYQPEYPPAHESPKPVPYSEYEHKSTHAETIATGDYFATDTKIEHEKVKHYGDKPYPEYKPIPSPDNNPKPSTIYQPKGHPNYQEKPNSEYEHKWVKLEIVGGDGDFIQDGHSGRHKEKHTSGEPIPEPQPEPQRESHSEDKPKPHSEFEHKWENAEIVGGDGDFIKDGHSWEQKEKHSWREPIPESQLESHPEDKPKPHSQFEHKWENAEIVGGDGDFIKDGHSGGKKEKHSWGEPIPEPQPEPQPESHLADKSKPHSEFEHKWVNAEIVGGNGDFIGDIDSGNKKGKHWWGKRYKRHERRTVS